MTILTTTDLENTALDCLFISKVANVDYTSTTATNRDGDVIDTVIGRLARLGYEVPIAYAGSISFLATDYTKTIERSGIVYAPVTSALPFTTSVWGTDAAKFFVIQDTAVTTALVTDVADLVTLTGRPANSTTMGAFTSLYVPDSLDLKATLEGIGDNIKVVYESNRILVQTITTTAVATQDIVLDSTLYRYYEIEIIRARPASGTTAALRGTIDSLASAASYTGNYELMAAPAAWSGAYFPITFTATMESTDRVSAQIKVSNLLNLVPAMVESEATYTVANNTANKMTNCKVMVDSSSITALLTLYWSNGVNFTAGTSIRVYGYPI